MHTTHGPDWVAWQEAWLNGLKERHDEKVFAVTGSDYDVFQKKFEHETSDAENRKNCFDPEYELEGERAKSILDWERRQLFKVAKLNNLEVVCKGVCPARTVDRPEWYPIPASSGYPGE